LFPDAVHVVLSGAFPAMQLLSMQTPTLQPVVRALQSPAPVHATHFPKPTHLAPFGQGIGS
jgi:hypothetical protein